MKYGRPIYDHSYIALAENVRFLRAKVIEIIPQGCVIQTTLLDYFSLLRKAPRGLLLRCLEEHILTHSAPHYPMIRTTRFSRGNWLRLHRGYPYRGKSYYTSATSRLSMTRAPPTSSFVGKWSGGRRRQANPRNACNILSVSTALPSEKTQHHGRSLRKIVPGRTGP